MTRGCMGSKKEKERRETETRRQQAAASSDHSNIVKHSSENKKPNQNKPNHHSLQMHHEPNVGQGPARKEEQGAEGLAQFIKAEPKRRKTNKQNIHTPMVHGNSEPG